MKTRFLTNAILAIFAILLASADAHAYGWCGPGPNRFPDGPEKNGGGDSSSTCEETAGDPIQIHYNGSQYHVFRDARVKGAMLDFDFYRVYTSNVYAAPDTTAFKETTLTGMFPFRSVTRFHPGGGSEGYSANWRHSYISYITKYWQFLSHGRSRNGKTPGV